MRFTLLFIICTFIISCGSDDSSGSGSAVSVLTTITIESSNGTSIDITESGTTLSATGRDQRGEDYTFQESIVWSADNDNISIDQEGNVTPVAEGSTVVTAESEGIEATITLTITDIFSQDYHVYVSDAGNFENGPWKIIRYDQTGEVAKVFTSENVAWPQDILFQDGAVLVSNLNTNSIATYNEETGEFIGNFATGISGPTRMKVGADNLLYVLQWNGAGKVLRYELDGTFVDEFTSIGINQAIGIDWDADGNLYVSSFGGANVRKFDVDGNDLGNFISSSLSGPTNIWFDDEGNLFVNDWTAGTILQFDSDGSLIGSIASGLSQVEGIAILPNGNFLVGNGGTGVLKEYTPSGDFVGNFNAPGLGGLLTPNAVVIKHLN